MELEYILNLKFMKVFNFGDQFQNLNFSYNNFHVEQLERPRKLPRWSRNLHFTKQTVKQRHQIQRGAKGTYLKYIKKNKAKVGFKRTYECDNKTKSDCKKYSGLSITMLQQSRLKSFQNWVKRLSRRRVRSFSSNQKENQTD